MSLQQIKAACYGLLQPETTADAGTIKDYENRAVRRCIDVIERFESALSQSAPMNTVFVKDANLNAQRTIDHAADDARDAARYRFRHSNYVDADGYEYGYCKVRWKNGAVDSMLWADDAEIDAAMRAAGVAVGTRSSTEASDDRDFLHSVLVKPFDAVTALEFMRVWGIASRNLASAIVRPDAHELWAASQLAPAEGIEDAVARIDAILRLTDRTSDHG